MKVYAIAPDGSKQYGITQEQFDANLRFHQEEAESLRHNDMNRIKNILVNYQKATPEQKAKIPQKTLEEIVSRWHMLNSLPKSSTVSANRSYPTITRSRRTISQYWEPQDQDYNNIPGKEQFYRAGGNTQRGNDPVSTFANNIMSF